jgi:serine/threonine protein kinase
MPLGTISEVGILLSKMHAIFSDQKVFHDLQLSFLQKDLPFAFGINKPEPKLLSYIRPGGIKYIQNIQSNEDIMSIWNSISKMWEMNSIIHGDIKLDNFLVIENPDNNSIDSQTVKIIDWEMVQYGDFAWDIAGVFQDFIFWWAISMPNENSAEEMVKKAAFPIHKLQPGIVKFWESYNNNSISEEQQREKLLSKVVHFAGLRVLQTAYEISSKFDEIPPIAEVLLGIGKSILRKPEEAAIHLFGIHNKNNQHE